MRRSGKKDEFGLAGFIDYVFDCCCLVFDFVLEFPFGWSYVSKPLYLIILAIYFLRAVVVGHVPTSALEY
jgi:hypothetical protein